MGDRAWWERGTQDSLIWTQIHSMNANTYRAKIKCVRFLYRYSTYNTGHRALSHTCSRKFLHTNFKVFTTEVHKQVIQTMCLYIYTNAPTSNMAKYRPQHGKSAPEFLNYSARVHLACHRIPDPPLVKPLTPASGV